ncbi:uncharacterized protein LOC113466398 [Diaphorina citri]|uniref:Uncharacterized protein LOC113466398 n=1 Tax=Diaphorina citri TaxID=121845 RepID=A0A3Q0IML6_DIACI|nr:uncharacterized protein LOC113466398 [Diaphorina citri]
MLRTKCLLVAFVFWLCHHGFSVVCNSPGDNAGRYLVYNPNGGVFKLIVGWAIPVEVPMSVIWGHNFQFQYKPVDNASQLAYPVLARPKLSRNTVYTVLEETLNMYGLDGPSCVLRTLCEASRYEISHDSIYGHILDTILT